jgi:transposase
MQIKERTGGDVAELTRRARREKDAEQKDRYLVAAHACDGVQTARIQAMLARSRGFVQRWAYAYRDGGIDALTDKPRGGSMARVSGPAARQLKARIDAGATAQDKVCTLRGRDVQRIINEELGVKLSLNAAYATLHRLGYSCLAPRPRHEKQDLAAQEKFKADAPLFSAPSGG